MNNELNSIELHDFFLLVDTGKYDDLVNVYLFNELKVKQERDVHIPVNTSHDIIRNISASADFTTKTINNSHKIRKITAYMAAACLLLIIGFSYLSYQNAKTTSFASIIPIHNVVHKTNNTNAKLNISLSDGSLVVLEPNASIYYVSNFLSTKREVFLEGNAFFNVFKDKQRPFFVYSGTLVTKVLGTSFNIKKSISGNIEVEVRSGKVQVFENQQLSKNKEIPPPVILQPNQKVVYEEATKSFESKLVDQPVLVKVENNYISESKEPIAFLFNRTNLKTIIAEFETHYGIDIVIENEDLNNCLFTGDLSEQDLYAKLKIICLTINANYEINGTKILITGLGCKNSK
jgi:hypothetical protein